MMNNIIELKKVKKVYKDITTVDIEKMWPLLLKKMENR